MEIVHELQQSIGTSGGTCIGSGTGTGTSVGAQDVDYCLI